MKKIILLFIFIFSCSIFANEFTGYWMVSDKESILEVKEEPNGTYSATVVWLREPTYPKGHKYAGEPIYDLENDNPSLQMRKIIGLKVGWQFENINGELKNGRIYDSRKGKTYYASAKASGDKLKLRGSIDKKGILGVTDKATRVDPKKYGIK